MPSNRLRDRLGFVPARYFMAVHVYRDVPLEYDEIVLIAIALATVFITVVYLIIATFSSQKMSRYTFSTSRKNTFGYCLSITVSKHAHTATRIDV